MKDQYASTKRSLRRMISRLALQPKRNRSLSSKLQKAWEGSNRVIKKMVITMRCRNWEEWKSQKEPSFEEFIEVYEDNGPNGFAVISEKYREMCIMPRKCSLGNSLAAHLDSTRGISWIFDKLCRERKKLLSCWPAVGKFIELTEDHKIFCLAMKERVDQLHSYHWLLWETICNLKERLWRLYL